MKYLCFVLCVVVLMASANARSCDSAMDCGINECCKDLGLVKHCLELRDEGDTCNGKFLCGCKLGSLCVEKEESPGITFEIGKGICTALKDVEHI